MTDTEERIAKLQKLLDRVLSRDDEPEEEPSEPQSEAKPEQDRSEPSNEKEEKEEEQKEEEQKEEEQKEEEQEEEPKVEQRVASPPPEPPAVLESRSRLVAAGSSEPVEELSDEDLIPESKVPSSAELDDAMPLVRRSRVAPEPVIAPPRLEPDEEEEDLSDGRIVLGLEDVQIADDPSVSDEERLAAEIAAEEVQSGEIEEDAPTSSRRPIVLSAEERHSPPPESGKQVAAPPVSVDEVTAVRKSSSPPAGEPDVIRPEIPAAAPVATFSGEPSALRPASFGELLDEALRL
jgi:hypothetical protein